ncbi:P-loop NTPase family protein [Streptomyces violascens]|uniref:adenylate kinase n=1 Tax=Streptomyces violascens TaxID=67381 RepID=UPI00365BBD69
MRRILVAGVTGSGKSTLARAVSRRLEIPYHEMDELYFGGPNWARNSQFTTRIREIAASPVWIFDSFGYPEVRDLLWERADTVVWLDYPRRVVMPRVLRRSLRRTVLRERVFNGNRETPADWFTPDHPARTSWTQHGTRGAEIGARAEDARFAPLRTLRFTTPKETERWLRTLEGP